MPATPKIDILLDSSRAEVIREQIKAVLKLEMDNQVVLGNPVAEVKEFVTAHTNPVDVVQTTLINICIDNAAFSGKHTGGTVNEILTVNIDVYARAQSTDSERGDEKSRKTVEAIVYLVQAILDSPLYWDLGLSMKVIRHSQVETITVFQPEKYNSNSYCVGRVSFSVMTVEEQYIPDASFIEESHTKMLVGDEGRGMQFIQDNLDQ